MMLMNEVIEIVKDTLCNFGYDVDFPITANKRFKTCNGRVTEDWVCGRLRPIKMEFSAIMLETATRESIYQVILHECAHALVALITNEVHHHDAAFKKMCRKIGCTLDTATGELEYDTKEAEYAAHTATYKWEVRCACCDKVVARYQRAGKCVKYPEIYQSNCCKGSLNVFAL